MRLFLTTKLRVPIFAGANIGTRRLKGRQTVGSILKAIADLLATATSETEYNLEKRDGYFDIIYERPTEL